MSAKHRFRPIKEWGSKARKADVKRIGRHNEESEAIKDQETADD